MQMQGAVEGFGGITGVGSYEDGNGMMMNAWTHREAPRVRKPYHSCRRRQAWTEEEHRLFVEAVHMYKRDWKRIQSHVPTKDVLQIRSHAQKYFNKIEKHGTGEFIPPARPKKRAAHPYPRRASTEGSPQLTSPVTQYPGSGPMKSLASRSAYPDVKSVPSPGMPSAYHDPHHDFMYYRQQMDMLRMQNMRAAQPMPYHMGIPSGRVVTHMPPHACMPRPSVHTCNGMHHPQHYYCTHPTNPAVSQDGYRFEAARRRAHRRERLDLIRRMSKMEKLDEEAAARAEEEEKSDSHSCSADVATGSSITKDSSDGDNDPESSRDV